MDRILKPNVTQINNVGLGQTWSCELPIIAGAYRYLDIITTMTTASAKTASAVTDFMDLVTLFANGKPFRTFLATEGDKIVQRYGSLYKAIIGTTTGSGNTLAPSLSGSNLAAAAANS